MVIAGYLLLAPPVFVLGPLGVTLLATRPQSAREWVWLLFTIAGISLAVASRGDLPSQIVLSGAVFGSGAYLIATLVRPAPLFQRASVAVAVAVVATVAWCYSLGIGFATLQNQVAADLRAAATEMMKVTFTDPAATSEYREMIKGLVNWAPQIGALYPGHLVLLGLAGLGLSGLLYHHIASRPIAPPPGRFRDFRFNDHLIWGAIFTLALLVVPLPPGMHLIARNGLLVWGGLYAIRGVAVTSSYLAVMTVPIQVLLTLIALFMQPFTTGGLLALGLADTWLDVRRRMPPPIPGGAKS